MNILWLARQAKHAAFVASKKSNQHLRTAHFLAYDLGFAHLRREEQYTFDKSRYRRSFINRDIPTDPNLQSVLPRRVYCFWTGDNPMGPARRACLDSIQSQMTNIELILITPENLPDYVLEEAPLHPAYKYLSFVHRSDYLRAYFMHHFGGGYLDIKRIHSDWLPAFQKLEQDETKWALGYGEASSADVAKLRGNLGHDVKKYHRILIGNGAYIFRSNTPFTTEWLVEQERRLDYFLPQLAEFPGGVRGEVVGYPVTWHALLAQVFHPLCLKYSDKLTIDDQVKPDFTDYL